VEKPNILVEVLIGMKIRLFSLFSFERELKRVCPLVAVRFSLKSRSSFSASIDFR
jgi:hypothetical protein